MAVTTAPGTYPHVEWIDLKGNGILIECAIMKKDTFGNIYFIQINSLDRIDKSRLVRILRNRNAHSFELWDLMSQITLNNGVNALAYFHQLVKIITPNGVITAPTSGQVGTGIAIPANYNQATQQQQPAAATEKKPVRKTAE